MTDDHSVPQQMIRRFADSQGKLWELLKPNLAIGTKRRAPKGILFANDYYKDLAGDLDPFFKKIEQKFARYYPLFAGDQLGKRVADGAAGAALVDWVASMLSRTSLICAAWTEIARKDNPSAVKVGQLFRNQVRFSWFQLMQDMLSRPHFKWSYLTLHTEGEFVLTDNPVLLSRFKGAQGLVVIAPFTRKRVLFGGRREGLALVRAAKPESLNRYIAAWAGERVYASSRTTLEMVAHDLGGQSDWQRNARKPYCGHLDHIPTMRAPSEGELKEFWTDMMDDLGPSILPRAE